MILHIFSCVYLPFTYILFGEVSKSFAHCLPWVCVFGSSSEILCASPSSDTCFAVCSLEQGSRAEGERENIRAWSHHSRITTWAEIKSWTLSRLSYSATPRYFKVLVFFFFTFTFTSLIRIELSIWCEVQIEVLFCFVFLMNIPLSWHHLLKRPFFLHWVVFVPA